MRKFLLLSFVLSLGFSPMSAAKLSQDEVTKIAGDFISSHFSTRSNSTASQLSVTPYKENTYVINNPSGGWVIVGADSSIPQQILAYSPSGHFSLDNLTDGARWILDEYEKGLTKFSTLPNTPLSPTRSQNSVAPLLGDIAWNQDQPYNSKCPEMDGLPTLAGCVNIAAAQIMAYHKYPQTGVGSHYYNWNDTRLSADFSKSTYRWDLMKPVYTGNESQEEIDAVAQLIYDLAIANESVFSPGETGANFHTDNLISFFDYDPGITSVIREQCKAKDYETILRSELDEGRPVYVTGGSAFGGHAFVCDGYDNEGYFHYNYGWGGDNNGYYLCSATGFDSYPTLTIGIQPNKGGLPGLWAGTGEDVYWTEGDHISCYFNGVIYSNQKAIIEAGLGLENISTGQISYFTKTKLETPWSNIQIFGFDFDDKVEDGEYILYPVCRVEGGQWKRVYVGENASDKVYVSVKNGVKTYTNSGVGGEPDPGVFLINGVYYRFDNGEATVTVRNSRANCYDGDVVIPDVVNYEGKDYPVTVIGEKAFKLSQLNTLTVGKNIRLIEAEAFTQCHVDNLIFAENSQLKVIASWAFNMADVPVIRLPEGLETIEACAFRGELKLLDIPSTVKFIPSETISCSYIYFKDLYLHWENLEDFAECAPNAITTDVSHATLHVPAGCIDLYKNHEIWGKFGKFRDSSEADEVVTVEGLCYTLYDGEATVTAPSTRADSYSGNIVIPSSIQHNGKNYPVAIIGDEAFKNNALESIIIGNNIRVIEQEAFSYCVVDDFKFAADSRLNEICYGAFIGAIIPKLELPEGLETINELAFNGAIDRLDLPNSIKNIPSGSLNSSSLKDLYVHWDSEDSLPFYDETAILNDVSDATLHVPTNCIDLYRSHRLWGKFGKITDDQSGIQSVIDSDDNINVVIKDGTLSIETLNSNDVISIYTMDGKLLMTLRPGNTVRLDKGLYILRIGNIIKKVVL